MTVDNLTSSLHGNYGSQGNGDPKGPQKPKPKRQSRRLKRRRRDKITSNGGLILMSLIIFVGASVLGLSPEGVLGFLTRIMSILRDP